MKICEIYNRHSIGCYCGDGISYPNKIMFNILTQLNIIFKNEYSPDWIAPKRYDFYFELNNQKYIIEMDGSFHYNKNRINGQTVEQSMEIDIYKEKLAKEHDVNVIRIDSQQSEIEYIKSNICNSKLAQLFKLSIINWKQCEEFGLSNTVKQVCEFKTNHPEMTSNDIGDLLNINGRIIRVYLTKGSKIGWCIYNPIEENKKGIAKSTATNRKKCSKAIEVFKDNKSLGVFESCAGLSRQSQKLFGTKLCTSAIAKVCKGKYISKNYKGFTFKYV